ncbi:MAG: retropepsin-like aspartic protease [Candidatus Thiodiazotropha taylori]|nr:retroviral-like aspartic protease family protein [Candidatus Thiodiazotropha taylori]MCG7970011.1 retroviral-like aspartic protease family protein [Candidatus Thiodiazotropha taylori]MCG8055226.1 retroviral-like aspartic protease family protein [Candidatus Thiodiazotropha taylori]MCW4240857.1 retroviral-like aspartic protease family protein [Candidatus Thiodiazotropha taylori]MCW4291056.1 retroviral-like aspartic protease family protein [Candidatus Thiodiazotropha taylori]
MTGNSLLWAEPSLFGVPMHSKGANTFYISGKIGNMAPTEFMVDTGSSYMTINENTLAELQAVGNPRYLRDLKGVLANGAEMLVPVYTITDVLIGEKCLLEEVEVAVFPGKTRQILGLSALLKTAPFTFSAEPPQLQLSNCNLMEMATDSQQQTQLAAGISTPN